MEFTLKTQGFCHFVNITPYVEKAVSHSKIKNGLCLVFVPGSTAAITTIEWEEGVLKDLKNAIERLIPRNIKYLHDQAWGDGNGFAHVRAAFFKPSLCLPVEDGRLVHGTWQQIVLIDFDNRPRQRTIKVIVK